MSKQKLSKAQFKDLLNTHIGVGVIHYHSSDQEITSFDFCISPKGQICFVANGKPIELQVTDLNDDNGGTSIINVVSGIAA